MAVWEAPPAAQQNLDLAILVPHKGTVSMAWMKSFIALEKPGNVILYDDKLLPLEISRNLLVENALRTNAKRFFFLDDDVIVPPDGLKYLITAQDELLAKGGCGCDGCKQNVASGKLPRHGPVVSGLYYAKKMGEKGKFQAKHPALWKITQRDPLLMGPINLDAPAPDGSGVLDGKPIECDFIGAGCMLVDRRVFEQMPKPWFKWKVGTDLDEKRKCKKCGSDVELWDRADSVSAKWAVSEDFYFNELCDERLGIKPIVLTNVKCSHVASAHIGVDGELSLLV